MKTQFSKLEKTFLYLETKVDKLNQNALRERKFDLSVMSYEELEKILQSKIGNREKRRILLTQIGFLRINIFNECYTKIQSAETNKELDEAVKIMQDYIETVAMQFIQERLNPTFTDKIINLFSKSNIPDTKKTLEEWKNSLLIWLQNKSFTCDKNKEFKDYTEIKEVFITLDMLSFSLNNFPPLATEPTH